MPKVKKKQAAPKRRRAIVQETYEIEEVRVSSILFGVAMLIALTVAAAAWMGGSLSQIESRFANASDGAARAAGLAVSDVKVYGLENEPDLESLVRGAAMIEPGENMFRADPYLIRQRVEQTERVLNVRVHRLWPGQVVILAEKADASAAWNDSGRLAFLDPLGREVAAAPGQDTSALLLLEGQGAPSAYPSLIQAFEDSPELFLRIRRATRVAGSRWTLNLDTGVVVLMPSDAALAGAVSRLAGLDEQKALTRRAVASIDLRAPGAVFLKPKTIKQNGGAA